MRHIVLIFCILLFAISYISAQPDPNGGQPVDNQRQPNPANRNAGARPLLANIVRLAGEQRTELLHSPQGLFVLRSGVLAKYHAVSLEPRGILDLFPPADAVAPPGARRAVVIASDLTRMLPASILAEGQDLLILIGDSFFRVDADTLEVKVSTLLLMPGRPAPPEQERLATLAAPVTLDRDPLTPFLYIARGMQLMIVNVDTGQVVAGTPLPARMMPQQPNPVQFMRGAGQPAAGAAPMEMTVIGQIVRQGWQDNPVWAVKDEKGDVYLLRGAQLEQLLKTPNIEGKRVRLNGMLVTPAGEDNAGQRVLEIKGFQVLP